MQPIPAETHPYPAAVAVRPSPELLAVGAQVARAGLLAGRPLGAGERWRAPVRIGLRRVGGILIPVPLVLGGVLIRGRLGLVVLVLVLSGSCLGWSSGRRPIVSRPSNGPTSSAPYAAEAIGTAPISSRITPRNPDHAEPDQDQRVPAAIRASRPWVLSSQSAVASGSLTRRPRPSGAAAPAGPAPWARRCRPGSGRCRSSRSPRPPRACRRRRARRPPPRPRGPCR